MRFLLNNKIFYFINYKNAYKVKNAYKACRASHSRKKYAAISVPLKVLKDEVLPKTFKINQLIIAVI